VEDRVSAYIRDNGLLSEQGLHLVAVSGGGDSVALMSVLQRLGYRVEIVHCNFRLRGEESDRDEQFVADLCQRRGIPLHRIHFDTFEYASLHKVSIEMAARELRYRYFEQLRKDVGAETVCVAHHRDDVVETLLMNLMRGTGIHGLTGIRPRNGYVVRPLLCVSRDEILKYLDSIAQDYVTDSTNQADDALRNRIRHHLVPMMEQIVPHSSANMARSAMNMQEAERWLDAAMKSQFSLLVAESGERMSVDIRRLVQQPSVEFFLFEWLSPYGFSPAQVLSLSARLSSDVQPGLQYLSASHELIVDRDSLILAPLMDQLPQMRIPETGVYRYQGNVRFKVSFPDEVVISKSTDSATFDKALVRFPIVVRPVQQGDRFHPFGMKGSRLVSDYLTDRKVTLFDKRRQLVVADASGAILWLVGHRIDNRFRVTADTTAVLRIDRNIE